MSTDDDPITEHRLNASYFVGRAGSLEDLANGLLKESGDYWANKRTEIASYLRDTLVPRLEATAKLERASQKKEQAIIARLEAEENANG